MRKEENKNIKSIVQKVMTVKLTATLNIKIL